MENLKSSLMHCLFCYFLLWISFLFSYTNAEVHYHNFIVCHFLFSMLISLFLSCSFCWPWICVLTTCVALEQIQATPVKRLCKTQNIITVNGQFPGPTLEVRNGDTLTINVVNHAKYNISLHWYHNIYFDICGKQRKTIIRK